ncbi:hypothetical protein OHA57_39710 (plasmid) [Streptomyces anulatus]|uniref:hypothetical protein n=1 Tax=Streptomyces anulatus TaxID=1892 RepID=UPI002DD81F96|nr:hypothetical protein [Streptomyces anulatus]WSC66883.1 hypothetical protein OHA57_39710 [Streptomyces anulatus]
MARKPKPVTWYTATPADGIIELSRQAGTPVSLPDAVGQVIDHPNPCANKWFDESPFSYFRMVKRVGEVLEDTGIWPAIWPVRLWIVEPVGDAGNWSHQHFSYRLLSHQIRVLEETDPWPALGAGGREVLDVIHEQIPERAARWAADWDADPEGMRERRRNWRLCGTRDIGRGEWAQAAADMTAYASRESAAQRWAEQLATDTADRTIAATDVSQNAVDYARSRAVELTVAAQHQTRLSPYVLDALRGARLDAAPTIAA